MLTSFFGLCDEPFKATAEPRFVYFNRAFKEAHDSVLNGVRDRRGLEVVVGEAGAGKTALIRRLALRLEDDNCWTVFPSSAELSSSDVLTACCDFAAIPREHSENRAAALSDYLRARQHSGGRAALLIDEAQDLSEKTLEQILSLRTLRDNDGPLITIVLAGRPTLESRSPLLSLMSDAETMATRSVLTPLDADEVEAHIVHQLTACGYTGPALFSPEAIERVAHHSKGLARAINVVCGAALMIAGLDFKRTVSAATVDQAARDCLLSLEAPSAADCETTLRPVETNLALARDPRRDDEPLGPALHPIPAVKEAPTLETPVASSKDTRPFAAAPGSRPSPRRGFSRPLKVTAGLAAGLAIGVLVATYPPSMTMTSVADSLANATSDRRATVSTTKGRLEEVPAAYQNPSNSAAADTPSAYASLALVHQSRGDLEQAEALHRKTLNLGKSLGRQEDVARSYNNLGSLHMYRGELDQAEDAFQRSLDIHESMGNLAGVADNHANLGSVYWSRGELDRAEAMYREALRINETEGRSEKVANTYGNLGLVYQSRGDLEQASLLHTKALGIYKGLGRATGGMANTYRNLGYVLKAQGALENAEAMFRKSLELYQSLGTNQPAGGARNRLRLADQ